MSREAMTKIKAAASKLTTEVTGLVKPKEDKPVNKLFPSRTYVSYQVGSSCTACGAAYVSAELVCGSCGVARDGLTDTGRYKKGTTVLGKGGFGEVYDGTDVATGLPVAMKFVEIDDPSKAGISLIRSTVQEARLLMSLSHPNIVRTMAVFVAGADGTPVQTPMDPASSSTGAGSAAAPSTPLSPPPAATPASKPMTKLCMVMEKLTGGSVWDLMEVKGVDPPKGEAFNLRPLSEKFVQHIVRSVLHALVFIHERGICHLDIKPQNILLTDKREVKLADFGLAFCMEREAQKVGKMQGTILWMAPELFHFFHQKKTTTEVDIWSLALTAETMLTGKVPYAAEKGLFATLRAHRGSKDYVLSPGCSPLATAFLTRCLRGDPKERPPAAALLHDPWLQE